MDVNVAGLSEACHHSRMETGREFEEVRIGEFETNLKCLIRTPSVSVRQAVPAMIAADARLDHARAVIVAATREREGGVTEVRAARVDRYRSGVRPVAGHV